MDAVDTMIDSTPAAGLSCSVAAERTARTAPGSWHTGTALPFAGHLVQVAFGARVPSLPGLPARGAPV